MMYAIAADAVLVIHALFIAFVALGGLLVLWHPRVAWLHLVALVWGATVIAMGWICPLTPLENNLRALAEQATYDAGFIQHYLVPFIYPPGLTRSVQVLLAAVLIVGNVLLYALIWRRTRRRRVPIHQ